MALLNSSAGVVFLPVGAPLATPAV